MLQFALLLAAVQLVTSQFVATPTNFTTKTGYAGVQVRYKEVPAGICELRKNVKSYSGYADVSPDQHIFWWFFEARNGNASEAPLTVWINGGPGSSSMIGLFQELGPCRIHSDMKVYDNPYSWSNVSNMLFIDEPTQVGFSYSTPITGYIGISPFDGQNDYIVQLPNKTCPDYASDWSCGTYSAPNITLTANNTPAAAPNMWKTIQGFMGAFPQYTRDGFYFTTESYGGHYAPAFNDYILKQNANLPQGAHKIDLKAVLIGNGWYDPLIQYEAYYNYSVGEVGGLTQNTYDYAPFNETFKEIYAMTMFGNGNCLDKTRACNYFQTDAVCHVADNWCIQQTENLLDIVGGVDEYDIRYMAPDPFPPTYYVDYLNTEKVQQAIGAFVNFSESNSAVGQAFDNTGDDDRDIGTIEAVKRLYQSNVSLTLYWGDADYNCNWLGGQKVVEEVNATGYAQAGFTNITTPDHVVNGQVKQTGDFAFVRIYWSGHEVPFYQPLIALEMFSRVLEGKDIATGTHKINSTYKTSGPQLSTFREGNATIQTEVLDASKTDYYYDVITHLPVFANGTSANTGYVPPEKRDLRSSFERHMAVRKRDSEERERRGLTREEQRRRERDLKSRRHRWRRGAGRNAGANGPRGRVGSIRMPVA